jgi:NAD(P)-dependent dehydrogenase (short-subunit alcohol dehydrogenase family)
VQIVSFGGETVAVTEDVSKPDQINNLVEAAVKAFGRADIVVNDGEVKKAIAFVDYPIQPAAPFGCQTDWTVSGLPGSRALDGSTGTRRPYD